jgi:hypothetical protein
LNLAVGDLTSTAVAEVRKLVLAPGKGVCRGVQLSSRDAFVVEKLCGYFGCRCIDQYGECGGLCKTLVAWRAFFFMIKIEAEGESLRAGIMCLNRVRDTSGKAVFKNFRYRKSAGAWSVSLRDKIFEAWREEKLFELQ